MSAADSGSRVGGHRDGEEQAERARLVHRRDPSAATAAAARLTGPGATIDAVGHRSAGCSRSHVATVVAQDLERARRLTPADHVDGLVLEELVRVEEVLDLDEPMGPHLLQPLDVRLVRVALGDAQDLVVGALLVAHLEHANRARPDVAAGERRLVDDEQARPCDHRRRRGCPR